MNKTFMFTMVEAFVIAIVVSLFHDNHTSTFAMFCVVMALVVVTDIVSMLIERDFQNRKNEPVSTIEYYQKQKWK